ncbi:Hypothetical protein A7982_11359 [Minicystis rosea]|nr:Hypothetical protein A7982_11359 [Minicystis rosea]
MTGSCLATARSAQTDSKAAGAEIVAELGAVDPACILFFAGIQHDGAALGDALRARFPEAQILGCSSNGEFSDRGFGKGGVVAMALGRDRVRRAAVTLAPLDGGVEAGIVAAARALAQKLGTSLRELSPERYACVALLEGAHGHEEAINEAFGNVSPFLPFVGGSAGDDITFSGTWVYADGALARDACAFLVLDMAVPFIVLKTANYLATDTTTVVTRTDGRVVLELDGEPAAARYARVIGTTKDALVFADFLAHPLGLMIDGQPWLRSVVRTADGGGLFFACSMLEGMRLRYMRGVDLVEDAREKLTDAAFQLGGHIGGGILFNCAYRMVEAQIHGSEHAYHELLSTFPHAGLHSNGESYIGHMNQTLTGLLFA